MKVRFELKKVSLSSVIYRDTTPIQTTTERFLNLKGKHWFLQSSSFLEKRSVHKTWSWSKHMLLKKEEDA